MEPAGRVETKITDAELRRMTRSGVGSATVIVELDIPHARAKIERNSLNDARSWRIRGIEAPSEGERRVIDDVTTRGQSFLAELALAPPVPLAGGSFAVRVTGDTLGAIARSPLVRRIYRSELRR
jgi:hypothetical protein